MATLGSDATRLWTRVSLSLAISSHDRRYVLSDEQALRFWLFWPDFALANLAN